MVRKFSEPFYLHSDSSPVPVAGEDPVVRSTIPNRNNASSIQWRFQIEKLNAFNYFVTGLNVPGVNIGSVYQPTPFSQIKGPGDSFNYEPLTVSFNVAEDLENILEIHRWMRGAAPASDYRENKALVEGWDGRETSNASLTLTTNAGFLETVRFEFQGLFPTSISGFELQPVVEEYRAVATFEYTTYTIVRVPDGDPYK